MVRYELSSTHKSQRYFPGCELAPASFLTLYTTVCRSSDHSMHEHMPFLPEVSHYCLVPSSWYITNALSYGIFSNLDWVQFLQIGYLLSRCWATFSLTTTDLTSCYLSLGLSSFNYNFWFSTLRVKSSFLCSSHEWSHWYSIPFMSLWACINSAMVLVAKSFLSPQGTPLNEDAYLR